MKPTLKLKITSNLLVLGCDLKKRKNLQTTLATFREKGTIKDTFLTEDANKLARIGGFFNFEHFIEVVMNSTIEELETNYAQNFRN